MPQAVTGAFARLRASIASFTIAQRTIAIIGVAVLVMGAFALTSWLTRPTMTPLFSGLSASDASAIVDQLRSSSVGYELSDGGSTILVPESAVYEQRLVAASAGLPGSNSSGYSLLDDMGVTTSEFQQSVTYKRAIEGELASTIAAMSGVTTASVQLAIPEESVFVAEKVDPTASVFIETRNGTTLTAKQVEAIIHLTSAAVSGLRPTNVAVVDQTGATLSAIGGEAANGANQVASEYEARVATGVQQMLDTVIGAGKATVTVIAEIDRAITERVEEVYTPADGAPPASEQVRTETQTGSGNSAGVLGPDNIAVPDGTEGSTYESTEETRNNVVNKTIESRAIPAGSVTRQSVSVAVDAVAAAAVGTQKLSDLVATAAGIDAARGDVVTVEAVEFSTTTAAAAKEALEAAKEAEAAERTAALVRTVIIVGAILAVLGVGTFLVLRMRRRGDATAEFEELFGERPAPLSTIAAAAPVPQLDAAPTTPLTLEFPTPAPETPIELEAEVEEPAQLTLQRRRGEIDMIARSDPKRTAELLRSMLDERQPV